MSADLTRRGFLALFALAPAALPAAPALALAPATAPAWSDALATIDWEMVARAASAGGPWGSR